MQMPENAETRRKKVGEIIRQARKRDGCTQTELAKAIGKSKSSIQKYEQGDVEIPSPVLFAIACALNLDVTTLLPIEDRTPFLEWLNGEGISFENQRIGDQYGKIVSIHEENGTFNGWLTDKQFSALSDMSIEQVKTLIRSLSKYNS